jgi:hypothetical protein
MVATYRLIKDGGHATLFDSVRDVLLQLPKLAFSFWILGLVECSADPAHCHVLGSGWAYLSLYIGRCSHS